MSSLQQLNLGENQESSGYPQRGGDRRKRSWFDPSINIGVVLHMVGVLIAIVLYGAAFDKRTMVLELQVHEQMKTLERMERKMNRLEHYISSKDGKYWKQSKANGDADD